MAASKVFSWTDPRPITRILIVLLAVAIVWHMMGVAIFLTGLHLDRAVPAERQIGVTLFLLVYGLLWLAVLAVTVLRVFWLLRVSRNAHVLKGRSLANSPIFTALWWYLIPFMSFFKPWESLAEIWDVSAVDRARSRQWRSLIGVWWVLSLAAGIVSYFVILAHATQMSPVISIIGIVTESLFIFIAKTICDMQLEKRLGLVFSDEPEGPVSVLERLNG